MKRPDRMRAAPLIRHSQMRIILIITGCDPRRIGTTRNRDSKMHQAVVSDISTTTATSLSQAVPLGGARPGFRGHIAAVDASAVAGSLAAEELERRLIELGLVEGAHVEVRHQGLFGRDPIAVRINGYATFALRRREAAAVFVLVAGADRP